MPESRGRHAAPGRTRRPVGWVAVIGMIVVAVAVLAGTAFSVVVDGVSMQPTLDNGDRVLVDPRGGLEHIDRLDVVHALAGPGGVSVVKRVVGLPGDRVAMRPATQGRAPTVWVQPGGQGAWQVLTSTHWDEATVTRPCCTRDGTASSQVRVATVPRGHLFLLGDNLGHSDDSRVFGWVAADRVRGHFVLRLTPLGDLGPLPQGPRLEPAHEAPPSQASAS